MFGPTWLGKVVLTTEENGNWPLSSWGGLEGGLLVTGWPPQVLSQSWVREISFGELEYGFRIENGCSYPLPVLVARRFGWVLRLSLLSIVICHKRWSGAF